LILKVIDTDDVVTSKMCLMQTVSAVDEMTLDTRSVVAPRMRRSGT